MKSSNSFKGKTALVTGGAAGIGRGICEALCARGAIVYAADINKQGLQQLLDQSPGGSNMHIIELDVSRQQDFQQAIDTVLAQHGSLDIVINNAGIVVGGDFNDTEMADNENIININLWSVIYGTKLGYAQMRKQGHGHIVNVSSSAGMMPVPNSTLYCAIKHAVIGLSHSLREEAELYGIKVSAVLPGMVKSDLWDNAVNVKDYNYKATMEKTGIKPIPAAQAADEILQGIAANDRSIIFPRLNKVILRLYQLMPATMTKLAVKPLAKSKS
jgi:short-subunit dehydrogenase